VTKDGVSMKMTGGTLSVEGAPVSLITWSFSEKLKRTLISMKGSTTIAFTDSYFEECFNLMMSNVRTFLARKKLDE
jgi:hypothetical protein